MIAPYITKELVDFCRHDIDNLVIILELLTSRDLDISIQTSHLICQTGKKMMYNPILDFLMHFEIINLQAQLPQVERRHNMIYLGPVRMRKQHSFNYPSL